MGEPTLCPVSRALFRSLMCRSILKPGLKLPSRIMGTLAFITVEPARPPLMASKTRCGSTPAFLASVKASATAAMLQATIYLVGQLGGVARADRAAMHGAGAHFQQDVLHRIEHRLVAADHDGQRAVDGLGFAAADRGVDHLHALWRAGLGDFLRCERTRG